VKQRDAEVSAFIHGANFHIYSHDSDRVEALGFYTNAFSKLRIGETAEFEALELIRHSPKLRDVVRNPPDDPPRICVKSWRRSQIGRPTGASPHRIGALR
jgi:hypothetical protein